MILTVLFFSFVAFEMFHNYFYLSKNVQMASGQGWGRHGRDADDEMNRNTQKIRVIMMPANSSLTNMRVMRTTVVTVTMVLDENLDANVNMNRTHIDLQILRRCM